MRTPAEEELYNWFKDVFVPWFNKNFLEPMVEFAKAIMIALAELMNQ